MIEKTRVRCADVKMKWFDWPKLKRVMKFGPLPRLYHPPSVECFIDTEDQSGRRTRFPKLSISRLLIGAQQQTPLAGRRALLSSVNKMGVAFAMSN